MQLTASQTRPGDLVRGIGLVIESRNYNEETNEATLTGYVTDRLDPEMKFATGVILPGPHIVNVRREFQIGDIVTVAVYHFDDDAEDFMGEQYLRAEVLHVSTDERTVTVRREGDPTENEVVAVGFRNARHTA